MGRSFRNANPPTIIGQTISLSVPRMRGVQRFSRASGRLRHGLALQPAANKKGSPNEDREENGKPDWNVAGAWSGSV